MTVELRKIEEMDNGNESAIVYHNITRNGYMVEFYSRNAEGKPVQLVGANYHCSEKQDAMDKAVEWVGE